MIGANIQDDLEIAAKGLMDQFPVDSGPYQNISSFFAFAKELLLIQRPPSDAKQVHSLRSSTTNGTSSVQIPSVHAPLREALYTMGPNGPLFSSIAARDVSTSIAKKLPPALSLPTSTGGSFTASATSIVPNNPMNAPPRRLADTSRKQAHFPYRKRGDFSDKALGKLETTKWLEWGAHSSFAPDWDDGGVGGGYGAEGINLDWAYMRLKRAKKRTELPPEPVETQQPAPEPIDERLLLDWTEEKPKLDETPLKEEERWGITIDETLNGLRQMITLLGQMQTLRMAMEQEITEDERSLGTPDHSF